MRWLPKAGLMQRPLRELWESVDSLEQAFVDEDAGQVAMVAQAKQWSTKASGQAVDDDDAVQEALRELSKVSEKIAAVPKAQGALRDSAKAAEKLAQSRALIAAAMQFPTEWSGGRWRLKTRLQGACLDGLCPTRCSDVMLWDKLERVAKL